MEAQRSTLHLVEAVHLHVNKTVLEVDLLYFLLIKGIKGIIIYFFRKFIKLKLDF